MKGRLGTVAIGGVSENAFLSALLALLSALLALLAALLALLSSPFPPAAYGTEAETLAGLRVERHWHQQQSVAAAVCMCHRLVVSLPKSSTLSRLASGQTSYFSAGIDLGMRVLIVASLHFSPSLHFPYYYLSITRNNNKRYQ